MNRRLTAFALSLAAAAFVIACSGSSESPLDTAPTTDDGGRTVPNDGEDASLPGTDAGPDAPPDAGPLPDAGPSLPLGAPITAPEKTWTWVDFPDAFCDDGTTTGIGFWSNPASDKVMFFFAGGGACWDYETCVAKPSYAPGPFGATQLAQQGNFGGWIIDGAKEGNPFKDWNKVFVPYCTGDLHAGDAIVNYTDGKNTKAVQHKGRANVAAYLKRVGATLPSASQIAVTGSSAGGGGAILSYPAIRAYWPTSTSFLVNDSLPFLQGNGIPKAMREAWFQSWNLTPLLTPICGAGCVDDMSQVFTGISAKYPDDRMALLSFTTDYVIAGYYKIDLWNYWKPLKAFTGATIDKNDRFKHYYVDAWGHVLLTDYGKYSGLGGFLTKMITNDPEWKSTGPF